MANWYIFGVGGVMMIGVFVIDMLYVVPTKSETENVPLSSNELIMAIIFLIGICLVFIGPFYKSSKNEPSGKQAK